MEDDLKKIKIGPSSPQLGLPSPILPDDDDMSMESYESQDSATGGTTVSSVPLSISVASVRKSPPESIPVKMPEESHTRHECVREMKEIIAKKNMEEEDDDGTNASDLDSNAFYWNASPPIIQREYSLALDKALEKKSPKLFQLMQEMHIDDEAVKIAMKELVTTNEKVSKILKRMHEGVARKQPAPSKSLEVAPSGKKEASSTVSFFVDRVNAIVHGGDVQMVKKVAGKSGYFWKDEKLWTYPLAEFSTYIADVEFLKMQALQTLMEPYAAKYHAEYTSLRKKLRDVVTSGDYQLPPPTVVKRDLGHKDEESLPEQPIFQARTPLQWLSAHLENGTSRFNVSSFLKDCKLGPMEKEPQYFVHLGKAAIFVESFQKFVVPRERNIALVGRNFLFDLKKTDDILARFLEHDQTDMMLVVHKLSVLLAKESVLLRLWINYNLPNIAMWLCTMERMENGGERRLVSPFFPPTSRRALFQQLTALGVFDQETMGLAHVYQDSSASSSEDEDSEQEEEQQLYYEEQEGNDLRFSKMFARLFSSSKIHAKGT